MSQRTLAAHYRPNWNLAQAHGLTGYNCGYTDSPGESSFEEHQRQLVWKILEGIRLPARGLVLDVGCGIGGPTSWIADRYPTVRVVGLDYCLPSVEAAQANHNGHVNRVEFLQADAHHLPIASDSVDLVFNLESALHYANKAAFLRECARILRPGGTLCLADITATSKLFFAPLRLVNWVPSQFNSNLRLWSPDDYHAAFGPAGLRLERSEEVSRQVADSLNDGLDQIRAGGWKGARGFRGRFFYLTFLERFLRSGKLRYDFFIARRPFGQNADK